MVNAILISLLTGSLLWAQTGLEAARDRQDRPALEKMIADLSAAAQKSPNDAQAQYRVALASSYLAEVALEVRDKAQAKRVAEAGIRSAERAVSLKPDSAEYYRVLGTLCGQVIPANVLAGLSYGKRAREAVNKAIERDPKSARAWLARGVGNYYLPAAFGGGPEAAIQDLQKAIQFDPKSADAYLWLGMSLRKLNRNTEARQAFTKSLALNPRRVWAKEQLEKTPAQ
ncbi:MAG: tetratricopeptide repeat protein [Acidobacteria bacterium]|nr:tetratricopeptide repeat protein [Acidobacteriota bacterium]